MTRNSLRLRLVLGGALASIAALVLAGFALTYLFERHIVRTMAEDLEVHLRQLMAGVELSSNRRLIVSQEPVDPRFAEPISGLYWQASDPSGGLVTSRSLWDTRLLLPEDDPTGPQAHRHEVMGPGDKRVLVAERMVSLKDGDTRRPVRVAVAADLARASHAASAFAKELAIALGLLWLALSVATFVQVGLGLTPLDALRRRIADIRNGKSSTVPSDAPEEIRPLVEELNALLLAKEQEIGRSRGRAADLAHGLKTPLAALASDVERLKLAGQTDIARNIEQVGDIMNRHVDRELARARARGGAHTSAAMVTALAPLLETLIQTVSRTRDGGRIAFEVLTEPSIVIRMDRTDLAEVLGNLIENAARHARSVVKVSSHELIEGTSVVIEDDGAGIETEKLDMLSKRGVRLDERGGGAGLGLAIVQDVLDTYGWRLDLGRSALGGLRAAIAPSPGSRAGDQFGSAAHAGA